MTTKIGMEIIMSELYRIRVVRHCKRNEIVFSYTAATHPLKDDILWHRDTRLIVTSVAHVLTTVDVGTHNEANKLSFVEIEVI